MRKIKFRAWEPKHKHMFIVKEFGFSENNTWCTSKRGGYRHWNAPMMQFTGLKDKNGKEIYEGDILHCIFEDENYIVEWDEIGAGFLFHRINNKKRTGGIDYYEFEDICGSFGFEVIGNIYEDKYLLEREVTE